MNNYGNMNGFPINYDLNNFNSNLSGKLAKQLGDNMNFNKCDYYGKTGPNDLYDVYNGYIRGNMFPALFNQYKLERPYEIKPLNAQAEMLTKVSAYGFATHDLNLYLDTHPDDRDMVNLFKEFSSDFKRAYNEYERQFGPLFVDDSETYPWAWNDTPWPWENK